MIPATNETAIDRPQQRKQGAQILASRRRNHGAGRTANEAKRLAVRRQHVFSLWSAGCPQKAIAAKLGISAASVCLDLQKAFSDWREETRGSVGEHVKFELQRLNW